MPLKYGSDFIDGVQLLVDRKASGSQLQRIFKEQGLDVNQPLAKNPPGCFWLTLRSGPFGLAHNMPLLRAVVNSLRAADPVTYHPDRGPILQKVDSSRDVGGTFYATGNWRQKLKKLAEALEAEFDTTFQAISNCFDSCFQLVGQHPEVDLELRVKIYWKTLQLI